MGQIKLAEEVHSGHYVRVKTQPLEMPELVLFSDEMAAALNVDRSIVNDPKFIQFVSADVHGACKDLLKVTAILVPYGQHLTR